MENVNRLITRGWEVVAAPTRALTGAAPAQCAFAPFLDEYAPPGPPAVLR